MCVYSTTALQAMLYYHHFISFIFNCWSLITLVMLVDICYQSVMALNVILVIHRSSINLSVLC
jgi:hypothetical protein